MNTAAQITISETTTEKERFWKEQSKLQRESGLSRKAYCRQYQLSYDQFGYWEHKWRQQKGISKLLPVHLNRLVKTGAAEGSETICTLIFKNGHELKIHDKTVLQTLLSLWG